MFLFLFLLPWKGSGERGTLLSARWNRQGKKEQLERGVTVTQYRKSDKEEAGKLGGCDLLKGRGRRQGVTEPVSGDIVRGHPPG